MAFYRGQNVRIIHPISNFHNQIGTIVNIINLTVSDAGCGTNITVRLQSTGYNLDVNIFSTIQIVPLDKDTNK